MESLESIGPRASDGPGDSQRGSQRGSQLHLATASSSCEAAEDSKAELVPADRRPTSPQTKCCNLQVGSASSGDLGVDNFRLVDNREDCNSIRAATTEGDDEQEQCFGGAEITSVERLVATQFAVEQLMALDATAEEKTLAGGKLLPEQHSASSEAPRRPLAEPLGQDMSLLPAQQRVQLLQDQGRGAASPSRSSSSVLPPQPWDAHSPGMNYQAAGIMITEPSTPGLPEAISVPSQLQDQLRTITSGQDFGESARKQFRLYHLWPSDNRFCCLGFGMTGAPGHYCASSDCIREHCIGKFRPRGLAAFCCERIAAAIEKVDFLERPPCAQCSFANAFAWFCIIVPSSLYFVLAMPYFWMRVHVVLPLGALFFFFLSVGCLLATCCSDPGILPRREVILAEESASRLKEELGFSLLGVPAPQHEAVSGHGGWVDGGSAKMMVPHELRHQGYRWCSTCRIVRPPRASHCPDCDNCVLRFDHHCPFVNNCVGQRNYIFFVSFVTSVCCLSLWVLPFLFWYSLVGLGLIEGAPPPPGAGEHGEARIGGTEASSDHDLLAGSEGEMVLKGVLLTLGVAGVGAGLLVLSLWAYHVFLICSGLTTKEHWRGTEPVSQEEPPTQEKKQTKLGFEFPGMGHKLTLFSRRGPRLFNPRALVEATSVEPDKSKPQEAWVPQNRRRWKLYTPLEQQSQALDV